MSRTSDFESELDRIDEIVNILVGEVMGKQRYIIKVSDLTQTCWACPSQWEGSDIDGRPVYIRYRWGHLTIQVADWTKDPVSDGPVVFHTRIGDGLGGVLSTEDLKTEVNNRTDLVKLV